MNVNTTKAARFACLLLLLAGSPRVSAADAPAPEAVFTVPSSRLHAGQDATIILRGINENDCETRLALPRTIETQLVSGDQRAAIPLALTDAKAPAHVRVGPHAFVRYEYRGRVPSGFSGDARWEIGAPFAQRLAVEILPASRADATSPPPASESPDTTAPGDDKTVSACCGPVGPESSAVRFFKEHFFPYEPFYFIAGAETPNAKFQISFKYRVLNMDGPLAEKAPVLTGLHVGFTQTSLWDWNEDSAPFLDSSYKPELLYEWNGVDGGHWAGWLRLDLQGGVQHESNGKDGANSRSLNIAYLQPRLTIGYPEKFRFTLAPRAFVYLPDLDDNPDLPRYRGYVDLRSTLGWQHGLQLGSTARLGNHGDRGSLQLDLTYPMSELIGRSFSLYLHAQYFTGYGESFLLYRERTSAFRIGFAFFR